MKTLWSTSSKVARPHLYYYSPSSLITKSPLLSRSFHPFPPPTSSPPLLFLPSFFSPSFSSSFSSQKRFISTFENDPEKLMPKTRVSVSFPHNDNTLTLWEAEKGSQAKEGEEDFNFFSIFRKLFHSTKSSLVPQGYPESVSKDYAPFHLWSAVQNSASSASYVLATQSLLSAVGAGSAAVPAAVGVTWVLKDGMGCVASLFASGKFGDKLDVDQKRYKWLADCAQALGVAMETLTPLCPSLFLLIGSIANTLKTVALLVSGSSRMALVEGFATHGNFGDVVAKLHAQSTLTFFLGMVMGIPATLITGDNLLARVGFMCLFSGIGLASCYLSLSSVSIRRINPQRGTLLIDHVLSHSEGLPLSLSHHHQLKKEREEGKEGVGEGGREREREGKIVWKVPTPEEIGENEKFVSHSFNLSQERNIYLGSSLFSLLGEGGVRFQREGELVVERGEGEGEGMNLLFHPKHEKGRGVRFQREGEYLVMERGEGAEEGVHLLFHPKHETVDRFRALFTALLLQRVASSSSSSSSSPSLSSSSSNSSSLTEICHFADDQFDSLLEEMQKKGWDVENFRSLRLENDSLWEWE